MDAVSERRFCINHTQFTFRSSLCSHDSYRFALTPPPPPKKKDRKKEKKSRDSGEQDRIFKKCQCAVLYANIWLERRKNVVIAKQGVRSIGQKMATLYPGSASLSVGCKRRFIFWYSEKMLPSANTEKNRERGWRSSLRHFRSENCHWRLRIPCCFWGALGPIRAGNERVFLFHCNCLLPKKIFCIRVWKNARFSLERYKNS